MESINHRAALGRDPRVALEAEGVEEAEADGRAAVEEELGQVLAGRGECWKPWPQKPTAA